MHRRRAGHCDGRGEFAEVAVSVQRSAFSPDATGFTAKVAKDATGNEKARRQARRRSRGDDRGDLGEVTNAKALAAKLRSI
jgi:hypothetical protein